MLPEKPQQKKVIKAVTHGAFAQAGYEDIDPEQAAAIQNMGSSVPAVTNDGGIAALYLRKAYLESLLKEYESPEAGGFYTDKIVHMIVPKSMEERQQEEDCGMEHQQCADPEGSKTETYKTAMKSVIKSSPFERAMKVEAELNKLHGRIIKQLDSIKAYELEDRRLMLAEKQLELNKQKLTGEFEIDPDGSADSDEITDVVDDV